MPNWDDIPEQTVIPGYHGKFIHSEQMTVALWRVDANAPVPQHSHANEQLTYVIDGQFELTINGKTRVCGAGDVAVIPPHATHTGRALTDCVIMDIFHPRRDDYANGDFKKITAA